MLWLALASVVAFAAAGAAGSAARASGAKGKPRACQRFAAPTGNDGNSGSRRSPFATAWKLVQTLRPGQTGCLVGRLQGYVRFERAGRADAPITLRSAPGTRATICGQVYFAHTAAYWRVWGLQLDGSCATGDTVGIEGNHVTLDHDDVTNRFRGLSCIVVGSHLPGGIVVTGAVVRNNRIHDCGARMSGHTHAIYAAASRDARITDNYIYRIAGFSVQLYPDAQHTLVARNVVDRSMTRSGVVLAGEIPYASSYNLVTHNIISRNAHYGVYRSWAGPVGTGNQIESNCFWENARGNFPPNPDGLSRRRNIDVDPGFVEKTPGDYRLRERSPCSKMHPLGHVGP